MTLPWRTGTGPRPAGIPLPGDRMPLLHRGRPLKRWRYVGFYGEAVHLCVASARIGPARLSWWAVWDRGARTLVEASHRSGRPYHSAGAVRMSEGIAAIELGFTEGDGIETVSAHGRAHIWTRKQVVDAEGWVEVAGRRIALAGPAIIDDSAGYHARHTAWTWSAGTGTLTDGRSVAWNLVDGVHDSPVASERSVWVDGVAHEVGPVSFDTGLRGVAFAEGGRLDFAGEAVRAARENLVLVRSEYEQPFGTFTGSLPGAGELARGHGVMERHDVAW